MKCWWTSVWIKPLGQNFALPKGTVTYFLIHEIWTMCTFLFVKLNFDIRWPRFWWCDLLFCPLMCSYEIWTMCTDLRCKVNFDMSWPRIWQSVLLCCPLMYSHGILAMWNMTFTTKLTRLNCIDIFLLWSFIALTIDLTTNLIIRIR
jgi:hypothetical protein